MDQKYSKVKIFLDGVLLLSAFAAAYFIKRGHLHFESIYIKFLPIYFCCWLLSSLLTGKLKNNEHKTGFIKRLDPFFSSALFFTGMLSLLIYGLNLYQLSRFIVFGALGIFLLLEILVLSGNYLPLFKARQQEVSWGFSNTFFLLEFLLITLSFFAIHFLKIGTLRLQESYEEVLLLIYFLWIFTGLIVHRFQIPEEKNYFRMIYPFVKSNFIVLSIASLFVFGFRTGFSRLLVFGSLGVYACFEILVISLYYIHNLQKRIDIPEINLFEAPLVSLHLGRAKVVDDVVQKEKEEAKKIGMDKTGFSSPLVREKLQSIYLKRSPRVFDFVDRVIELDTIDIVKAEVIDTGNPYNVEILPDHALEFFMNLHTLNNYRRLNQYLILVNRKMKEQGILVGKFEPCERRHIYFLNNYPRILANILYLFDFTWKRVFPKLPILKKIYFAVTRGMSRVFSMAEALGRLNFCGFEIVSLENVDNFVYFVVQKVRQPTADTNPSYGLLFKQKRVGINGNNIYIYKMRTMHPYSEYVHQYIYDKNKLDEKGKIKDDFRITAWGKIFRKLLIDEIPMLINWFKGDLKLVGVRPLSETFFATYPQDLQKERTRYKPGLIPPYYADMPGSIEEVWESERRYLQKYEKHPRRTDTAYLFKALNNILFHKARSG